MAIAARPYFQLLLLFLLVVLTRVVCICPSCPYLCELCYIHLDPANVCAPLQPPAGHTLVKWGILEAFGIFAISVSGHTSLPVLRNSMKNPKACCTPCRSLSWRHLAANH